MCRVRYIRKPSGGPVFIPCGLHPGMWLVVQVLVTIATEFSSFKIAPEDILALSQHGLVLLFPPSPLLEESSGCFWKNSCRSSDVNSVCTLVARVETQNKSSWFVNFMILDNKVSQYSSTNECRICEPKESQRGRVPQYGNMHVVYSGSKTVIVRVVRWMLTNELSSKQEYA